MEQYYSVAQTQIQAGLDQNVLYVIGFKFGEGISATHLTFALSKHV